MQKLVMKKYIRPEVTVIALNNDICNGGLTTASVKHGNTKVTIDNFDVVNERQSEKMYDWNDKNLWGGD